MSDKNFENANPPIRSVYECENANKIPILFMMEGLAGSGKSFIAETLVTKRNGEFVKPIIHSSDALRAELYGDENNQEHNGDLFNELHRRIKEDLRNGKDVIYDATNISKKRRRAFLQELTHIECHKVCVCVLTPYEVVLQQNSSRERKVPEDAIKRMYLSWSPPAMDEGFDNIVLAYNYGDIDKNKFTLDNFFYGEINANSIDQENSHHSSTIGGHCLEAARYVKEHYPNNFALRTAALLHDIGKVFTKSHLNSRGEVDTECHYYNHQNCGSYDSFFYMDVLHIPHAERLHIANLIYYHMMPFTSWTQSKSVERRVKIQVGEELYDEIMKLNEADLAAH